MIDSVAVVGVALLYTVLAMWAAQPAPSCAMAAEPRRRLDVTRDVDREHLARDVGQAQQLARRLGPECGQQLVERLMTLHGVTSEQAGGR